MPPIWPNAITWAENGSFHSDPEQGVLDAQSLMTSTKVLVGHQTILIPPIASDVPYLKQIRDWGEANEINFIPGIKLENIVPASEYTNPDNWEIVKDFIAEVSANLKATGPTIGGKPVHLCIGSEPIWFDYWAGTGDNVVDPVVFASFLQEALKAFPRYRSDNTGSILWYPWTIYENVAPGTGLARQSVLSGREAFTERVHAFRQAIGDAFKANNITLVGHNPNHPPHHTLNAGEWTLHPQDEFYGIRCPWFNVFSGADQDSIDAAVDSAELFARLHPNEGFMFYCEMLSEAITRAQG